MKVTHSPDAIRLRSGLPRWRNVVYRRLVILGLSCLAAHSLWMAWHSRFPNW